MRSHRITGDYHLLVAQNFLSNISLSGTHNDTNLRIFNKPGMVIGEKSTVYHYISSKSDDLAYSEDNTDMTLGEAKEVSSSNKVVAINEIKERVVPAPFRNHSSLPEFTMKQGSSGIVIDTTKNVTVDYSNKLKVSSTPSKKSSLLKRIAKIVSSEDVLSQEKIDESIPLTTRSHRELKMTDSDIGDAERPSSPVSIAQLSFLKRLRTSLARAERYYLCSEPAGAPLAVLSHFSFLSSNQARIRRSRSSFGSTDHIRHIIQGSTEELRPFDFKDIKYINFGYLWNQSRGGCSSSHYQWRQYVKKERRGSDQFFCSVVGQLDSVDNFSPSGTSDPIGINDYDETELDELDKILSENYYKNDYDPHLLEDVEAANRTIIRTNGFIGSTKRFAPSEQEKIMLNETFSEKFPNIQLTYSKLRSIKRDLWTIAKECDVDYHTLAHAYVFYEKIVLQGLISKYNRKIVAGATFLVAVKLNDYNKMKVKNILEHTEDCLRISRRELLLFELPLCCALHFDLFPPAHHLEPHYRKLLFGIV